MDVRVHSELGSASEVKFSQSQDNKVCRASAFETCFLLYMETSSCINSAFLQYFLKCGHIQESSAFLQKCRESKALLEMQHFKIKISFSSCSFIVDTVPMKLTHNINASQKRKMEIFLIIIVHVWHNLNQRCGS